MNGTEGTFIQRGQARTMSTDYRNSASFTANLQQEGILFGKNKISQILNQTNCLGIRIYYGRAGSTANDEPTMIIVGTDSSGNDIPALILDMGIPCPDNCSANRF